MSRSPRWLARVLVSLVVGAPLLVTAQQRLPAGSGTNRSLAGTTVAVVIAGRAIGETFTFTLGSQQVSYAAGSWTGLAYESPKTFPQSLPTGLKYAVSQTAGPRPCRLANETGTSSGSAVFVFADCAAAPSTFSVSVRASGTADGETVGFAMDGADRTDVTAPVRQATIGRGMEAGSMVRLWRAASPDGRRCALTAAEPWAVAASADTLVIRAFSDVSVTANCTAAAPATAAGSGTSSASGTLLPPRQRGLVAAARPTGTTSSLAGILRAPVAARVALQVNGTGAPLTVVIPPFVGGTDRYNEQSFVFTPPRASGSPYTVSASAVGSNLLCLPYLGGIGIMPQGRALLRVGCEHSFSQISTNSAGTVRATFYESRDAVVGGAADPVGATWAGFGEGRFVAFMSGAAGLVERAVTARQIYWHDRLTGSTILLSAAPDGTPGDGDSFAPAISADGLTVAFESHATNLVPGDGNGVRDVFVWSSANGTLATTVSRVSIGAAGAEANGHSYEPSLSGDGRVVAFTSTASNLTPGVRGVTTPNVYRRDLQTGQTTLVTRGVKGLAVGGSKPSISEDGVRIAFQSFSADLVTGDVNGLWDIFVSDQQTGTLARVSRPFGGGERNQGSESASREVAPVISGDGNVVAYATTATNLVPADRNGAQDVFVVDLRNGRVQRASVTADGVESNGDSPVEQGGRLALSYSGEWVAFASAAKNLGAPEGNIFMHNNVTGETRAVTTMTNNSPSGVSITRSGAYVAFGSNNQYDTGARSSGLFVAFTALSRAFMWLPE